MNDLIDNHIETKKVSVNERSLDTLKPQQQILQSNMDSKRDSATLDDIKSRDKNENNDVDSYWIDLVSLVVLILICSIFLYWLLNKLMGTSGNETTQKDDQENKKQKSKINQKYQNFIENVYDKILNHKILRHISVYMVFLTSVSMMVFAIIQLIHFINPGLLLSLSLNNLGSLGDFFGGFIGTFIAALTVIYAIRTYRLERQHQREASVAEMLNTMLELHKQNVSEIKIKNVDPNQDELISGRDAFKQMFEELRDIFESVKNAIDSIVMQDQEKYAEWSSKTRRMQLAHILSFGYFFYSVDSYIITTEGGSELFFLCEKIRAAVERNLKEEYKNLQRHRVLGHYYRHLYNMVNYIDKNGFTKDRKKKDEYVKLVRSQLSDYEEILLYYDSLTPLGREWNKPLKQTNIDKMSLICKYRLLKNCPSYIRYFGIQPWDTYNTEMKSWWAKEGELFFETDSKDQEEKIMEMLNGN